MFGHVVPAEYAEQLRSFYGGEVPEYVVAATRGFVVLRVPVYRPSDYNYDHPTGYHSLKITPKDVAVYFANEGKKFGMAGESRTIAGHRGPWRFIAGIANEAAQWFRLVNKDEYDECCRREGLNPVMCPLVNAPAGKKR
jgi:hypothetical protein